MRTLAIISLACVSAFPGWSEEKRGLSAHVHGHGGLNIAIEADQIAFILEVPGYDIVGFEHIAVSDADKAAIEAALRILEDPSNLFTIKGAGDCEVVETLVELLNDEDASSGATHSEFHADFLMSCSDMDALSFIELPYFSQFPNAVELDVQLVTASGAALIEATPNAPLLDISVAM